ncbi:polysaccharide pyruvyl transferase family protein [Methylobacterium sp. CM6241]
MKARLLGDHSAYHSGSEAAFLTLKRTVSVSHEITEKDDYDILFVNGEGSMHHNCKDYVEKMTALKTALDDGRKAALVNTVWQENGSTFDATLRRLHEVVVREPKSQADLLGRHQVSSRVHLDLSYYAEIDEDAPVTDWSKQIVVSDFHHREQDFWYRITRGPLAQRTYFDMRDHSWSSLVRSLRTCRLVVTGRHHAVYAACVARRPFVAMTGNTHKIEGLIAASGFPIPVVTSIREASKTLHWALENRGMFTEFFHWMDEYPRWAP